MKISANCFVRLKSARVLLRIAIILLVFGIGASHSPAPVIEAPETTPTPEQKTRPVEQKPAAEEKAPEQKQSTKPKRRREEAEAKSKRETPPPAPVKPAKAAAPPSAGFAGTWKGKLTDGNVWTIVVDGSEKTATAYGPGMSDSGSIQPKGNTISWSHMTKHQNNAWSLTLQSGGRRADVIAYHISGNLLGTFDRTN